MAIIKSQEKSVRSTKLILPIDGLVEIDADGQATVSDKCAEILSKHAWEIVKEKRELTKDENKMIDGLKKLKIKEAIELANESEYPEEEWEKFKENQVALTSYLVKKYKETLN